MKAITKQWLEYAKADILVAKNSLSDEFLSNIVAFHCQQTIEKCFKAIVEENSLQFKRIHSLYKLYEIIETKINFDIDESKLEQIDEIYTTSRYPSDIGLLPEGKPDIKKANEMYEFAEWIYNRTINMLSDAG